ncbi:hypothetical protein [Leeuwenhoekiella parthenopeia]|uniref:Transposase n=1 Tax=Leeuwenhoekiella parthenopeia TaxID=2890320 RepID=A0ABS8GNW6_9FLAO|nr:hypothetical protein [Leeuwenhoekiella parthenopeia]MCC4211368.1 hypothetical protein [Leeuwenhoekiella parthenopeia]
MPKRQRQITGTQRNKLLRYQKILDLYHKHKTEDNSVMTVWRKYIYPEWAISRTTLYTILGTPVSKELKEIQAEEDRQLSIF